MKFLFSFLLYSVLGWLPGNHPSKLRCTGTQGLEKEVSSPICPQFKMGLLASIELLAQSKGST